MCGLPREQCNGYEEEPEYEDFDQELAEYETAWFSENEPINNNKKQPKT